MGYGQRLRVHRTADVRVLKSQLDLIADVAHSGRLLAPVWALVIAVLGSSSFGPFGNRPLTTTIILPVLVGAASFYIAHIATIYRRDTQSHADAGKLENWFRHFVIAQILVSASWGMLPWFLWDGGNSINHIFMGATMIAAVSWLIITRASHIEMLFAVIIPVVCVSSSCFLLGGALADIAIGVVGPFYAAQLYFDGRKLTVRLDEDARLRFEVEDLARELEEARDEALRKRFEAETANASKTAFLANMSHELRTPLNAILGFSEIIAQECFGPAGSPRYKEYAGDIHSSGAHLLSLINDLLDVAKIEAGRMEIAPEPLPARQTLESALKIITLKARERKQQLVIEVDPDVPELYADERALKQILINLVSNAIKFTPEGGRIAVVASRARSGAFQLMVEDNGPGIPRDKLDKIFKPFSQVDNRYDRQGGGTGLGLALVRGLVELHGGRAWLESEQGRGARAYIVLPSQPNGTLEDATPRTALA